jgi:hypothetical protein
MPSVAKKPLRQPTCALAFRRRHAHAVIPAHHSPWSAITRRRGVLAVVGHRGAGFVHAPRQCQVLVRDAGNPGHAAAAAGIPFAGLGDEQRLAHAGVVLVVIGLRAEDLRRVLRVDERFGGQQLDRQQPVVAVAQRGAW